MAQKAKVKTEGKGLGILSSTRAAPVVKAQPGNQDLDAGKISPVGVGLTAGEKAALVAIAAEQGISLNALMRFALRFFIVGVRDKSIDLEQAEAKPEPQKKRLILPS